MNLENIWEFAIKIPKKDRRSCIQTLRSKVQPVIKILKEKLGCSWYCFLVHGNENGVPIPDYDGWQYHIRVELACRSEKELWKGLIERVLPNYCIELRESVPLEKISGLDESLYIDASPDTGWHILYWQCEWVYDFLRYHRKLTIRQIYQFMHFFDNIFARECMVEPRKKIMLQLARWFSVKRNQEAKGNNAFWCDNCNAVIFQSPKRKDQCNICKGEVKKVK